MGIVEEFLTPTIGGGRTVAVLARPLSGTASMGWVICHSFGLEQVFLQPLETPFARGLAAAGCAVLRFHCQGYGDAELTAEHISMRSHIDDSLKAVELLTSVTQIDHIGLMGARFGGTVAALVADRLEAQAMILWDPIVSGRTYMRTMARLSVMTELLTHRRSSNSADPLTVLREKGALDVQGFPLRREVFEEISKVDLPSDLLRFKGDSLLVQVSRSATVRPGLQLLSHRLEELGGNARSEVVTDRAADKFGRPRFRSRAAGKKVDTQSTLAQSLISRTLSWERGLSEDRTGSGRQR